MKLFKVFCYAVLLIFATSCSTSELVMKEDAPVEYTIIGSEEILSLAEEISTDMENYEISCSRATSEEMNANLIQTEKAIAQKSEPLVKRGVQMRNELVQIRNDSPDLQLVTDKEFDMIMNMTDDQLASAMLQIDAMSEYFVLMQLDEMKISSNLYVDCLLYATGVNDIVHIANGILNFSLTGGSFGLIVNGTKTIINAKTASKLLLGFAKRTAGWIGVGLMMIDFSTCVKNGKSR